MIRRFLRRTRARLHALAVPVAPYRVPVAVLGALLVVVGSWSPWATFSGFAGKMTLAYPGGARLYTLVLAAAVALAFVPLRGRRVAGEIAGLGCLGLALLTTLAIAKEGGGLVNVAWGAWVTIVGAVLLLLSLLSLPEEEGDEPARLPDGPAFGQLVGVLAILVTALVVVVEGLEIPSAGQFLAYLAFLGLLAAAAAKLGVFEWLQRAAERHRMITLTAALLAAAAFPFTQDGSNEWVRVGCSVGVFAAAAVGLNIVVGLAGLLDLGYIAFFGVGAYVGASLSGSPDSNVRLNLVFLVVIAVGAIFAAVLGVLIGAPTLRLRGDYLAIVTLGFGEIFRIAANNLDGFAGPKLTNGPNGIPRVPNLNLFGFDFGESHELFGITLGYFANYFFAELVLLAFVILAFVRLNNSRIGRAWVAIREDETAASAMGINTVNMKLLAFAIGAFLAGAAGTLNAHVTTQVSPDSYRFDESVLLLAAVVLGGMGTIGGAILGSTLLLVLPEKLRFFQEKRILVFGIALILMMRFRPEGIVPNRRRQREFHDDLSGADATSAPPGAPVVST
ncbi:MAG TPA: branched-chain amino acid ABC transporter permease [Frankiaceae bacterium]|nr:branched-chain amino acid ABC transporter permease [Frankiaceae bacterium]